MENNLPLKERSISDIYIDNPEKAVYNIPIYQRNYAWEEDEISALVKDVYDSYIDSKNHLGDQKRPYYIGTLVTYKRGDKEYEVIDGQQRLTTIYLILHALDSTEDNFKNYLKNTLTYSARSISAKTLANLPDFAGDVDRGIERGFKYAKKAVSAIEESDLEGFKQYFLHNVKLIHYIVPKDVDLNHYFEVMNSRGEQLEKHEIVKSYLADCIEPKEDMGRFNAIWEACSDMNVYIQQVIRDERVFGPKLDKFILPSFDDLPSNAGEDNMKSIEVLLALPIETVKEDKKNAPNDKFQPIIDFPNFILVVLKLTLLEEKRLHNKFALDDKELVRAFRRAIADSQDKNAFARKYIYNLLKARFFLDNFLAHHIVDNNELKGDNPWKLQLLCKSGNSARPENLCDDRDIQDEMEQLLSMFEVAFTPKTRKNYLLYCLIYLFRNYNESVFNEVGYLEFLRRLSEKYIKDVYLNQEQITERRQPGPNAFDTMIIRDEGLDLDIRNQCDDYAELFNSVYPKGFSSIPLFVFNYMDYKIWKKYAETLKGERTKEESRVRKEFFDELGCGDIPLTFFKEFYLSRTRKSLEHYYPQAKAAKDENSNPYQLTQSEINCFGNFAMIGAEANSSGSNWSPKVKLEHYTDKKANPVSVSSLKFKIMMQICYDNDTRIRNHELKRTDEMEWNAEDIHRHQERMLRIMFE